MMSLDLREIRKEQGRNVSYEERKIITKEMSDVRRQNNNEINTQMAVKEIDQDNNQNK